MEWIGIDKKCNSKLKCFVFFFKEFSEDGYETLTTRIALISLI